MAPKFAFFEADKKTIAYLKERTNQPVKPFGPDPDARYAEAYEIDVSSLEPQIACPHSIDNVKPVSEIGDVPVHQAFLGSCTNGREEDLEQAAAILKGRRVHPGTRLLIIAASQEIYRQLAKSGAIQTFLEAGAMICPSGCGPCGGTNTGPIASGETAISPPIGIIKAEWGVRMVSSILHLHRPLLLPPLRGKLPIQENTSAKQRSCGFNHNAAKKGRESYEYYCER